MELIRYLGRLATGQRNAILWGMGASIITFATLMGSGGTSISRAVAEKLRFRYYDWEIIARAAQEAGVSPEVLAVATS